MTRQEIESLTRYLYAVHKKLGCIKKIPEYAAGYMNRTEWVIFNHFPNEKDYFESLEASIFNTHNQNNELKENIK